MRPRVLCFVLGVIVGALAAAVVLSHRPTRPCVVTSADIFKLAAELERGRPPRLVNCRAVE
jgi:uncharacterized NAD-dependent epimerase/dehydratase family protein